MTPVFPPGTDWVTQFIDGLASLFSVAVIAAIKSLLLALGPSTEPDFHAILPAYNRMLGISLLLLGGVLAAALIERLLGGERGGGWNLVVRVVSAVSLACLGLPLIRYLAGYAWILSQVWDDDYVSGAQDLGHQVISAYNGAGAALPLGSALGLIFAGAISLLLALVVHVELFLRAALILVTATFVPFVAVLAIWPRFMGAASHLFEFLGALLLSKFVVATAVFVGFTLVVQGLHGPGADGSNVLVMGIAVLAVAALAPLALFQGLRLGHHAGAPLARGWTLAAGGYALATARRAAALGAPTARNLRKQIVTRGGPQLASLGGPRLAGFRSWVFDFGSRISRIVRP